MKDKHGQTADFDTLLAQMRKKHSEKLALGVALVIGSSQELAADAHVEVRGALKNLADGLHIFGKDASPETAFADLKRCAQEAFSESPTDAEILANSATPDLVRYLLSALRAYDGMPANLATAFKARNRVGKTEVWRLRADIINAANEVCRKLKRSGADRETLRQAAEDAGYEKFVNEKRYKIRPDTMGEKEYRSEIRNLLSEYFGWE